jgi:hypothetical protein
MNRHPSQANPSGRTSSLGKCGVGADDISTTDKAGYISGPFIGKATRAEVVPDQ